MSPCLKEHVPGINPGFLEVLNETKTQKRVFASVTVRGLRAILGHLLRHALVELGRCQGIPHVYVACSPSDDVDVIYCTRQVAPYLSSPEISDVNYKPADLAVDTGFGRYGIASTNGCNSHASRSGRVSIRGQLAV